ncbi:MAG: hypothetical protein HY554_17955 [Elusimicrobia bacterium]|nr:hypothetical protein [Elusimicrobiota bacterium]
MIKELDRRILTSCSEADLGLASIVALVRESFPKDDPLALRRRVMGVLTPLVDGGLLRAGRPTPDGKAFVAWGLTAKESVVRIEREWDALGHEPRHGDVAWFATTKAGVKTTAQD